MLVEKHDWAMPWNPAAVDFSWEVIFLCQATEVGVCVYVFYLQHNVAWAAAFRCSFTWLNHYSFPQAHVEIRLYSFRVFIILIETLNI